MDLSPNCRPSSPLWRSWRHRWPGASLGGSTGRGIVTDGGCQSPQVRDFAKSTGQLAKNDRLDARILAHFGEAIRVVGLRFGP